MARKDALAVRRLIERAPAPISDCGCASWSRADAIRRDDVRALEALYKSQQPCFSTRCDGVDADLCLAIHCSAFQVICWLARQHPASLDVLAKPSDRIHRSIVVAASRGYSGALWPLYDAGFPMPWHTLLINACKGGRTRILLWIKDVAAGRDKTSPVSAPPPPPVTTTTPPLCDRWPWRKMAHAAASCGQTSIIWHMVGGPDAHRHLGIGAVRAALQCGHIETAMTLVMHGLVPVTGWTRSVWPCSADASTS